MFAAVFGRQDPQFTKPFNKQCIFEADVVMVRSQLNTVSFYAHMIKNQFGLLSTTSIIVSQVAMTKLRKKEYWRRYYINVVLLPVYKEI